jgi:hypothetical protein
MTSRDGKPMTVEAAKLLKQQLESELDVRIAAFEAETGLLVTDIERRIHEVRNQGDTSAFRVASPLRIEVQL